MGKVPLQIFGSTQSVLIDCAFTIVIDLGRVGLS